MPAPPPPSADPTVAGTDRSDPVLARLLALHPKLIDYSLERVHDMLHRLGDPHRSLPPVVHVAGTNGKGSTVAFLRAMLEAAGLRVHVYTSPHLVRFHERIRIAGRLVDDAALADLLEVCERANGGAPITFFEITTAAAFLAFARHPADVVLLETGLGGRLDATNVVDHPAVTAITRISFDHMAFLGNTLPLIAAEKAGIMKPGVPCVIGPQGDPSVVETFRARAAEIGAPLWIAGTDWRTTPRPDDGFVYRDAGRRLDLPRPGLVGAHQIGNAGTAIACLAALPFAVPDAAVAAGVSSVEWPGRLQRLTRGPLLARLPEGWELWLDGAHNDSGGEVLAQQAARWAAADARPLDAIFGGLNSRDPADLFRPLRRHLARLRTVAIPGAPNAHPADAIAAAATRAGIDGAQPAGSVADAIDDLVGVADGVPPRRVLIFGSLYLAGTVLADHG